MGNKRKISLEEPIADVRWLDGVTVTPSGVHDTTRQEWREANAREREQDEINRFTGNIRNATNNAAKNIITALEYTPVVGDLMSAGHGINYLANGKIAEGLAPFVMPKVFSLAGKTAHNLYKGIRYGSMPERRFWETAMRTRDVDPTNKMLRAIENSWNNKSLKHIPLRYIFTGKGKRYWGEDEGYFGGLRKYSIDSNNLIDIKDNDPISAYLYGKNLPSDMFERIPSTSVIGGIDPNYDRFGKINKFYRIKNNYNLPDKEYFDNSKLIGRGASEKDAMFIIKSNNISGQYDAGGYGITDMVGPDGVEYIIHNDVWGFAPKGGSNYLKKWLDMDTPKTVKERLKELAIKRLNSIGHPFYVEDMEPARKLDFNNYVNSDKGIFDYFNNISSFYKNGVNSHLKNPIIIKKIFGSDIDVDYPILTNTSDFDIDLNHLTSKKIF